MPSNETLVELMKKLHDHDDEYKGEIERGKPAKYKGPVFHPTTYANILDP